MLVNVVVCYGNPVRAVLLPWYFALFLAEPKADILHRLYFSTDPQVSLSRSPHIVNRQSGSNLL